MYKLVISDMDGTLIGKDEALPERAVTLVQDLERVGVHFTLATGRVEEMASSYVKKLQLKIPYIASNGATIVQDDHVYQRLQIPVLPLRELIAHADSLGLSIIYSIHGVESVWRVNEHIQQQRKKFDRYHRVHQFSEQEWQTLSIDKLSLMNMSDDASISMLEQECVHLGELFGYTRYVDRSIEVVHAKATKANAVEQLAAFLHIPLSQVLFIGDHQNDLEVMDVVGMGVAVNNATEAVKAKATYVCEQQRFDGVLEAVRKFVFEC